MSIQNRWLDYADAFEESYIDDDWARLAQYFTEQAAYDSGDGDIAEGRAALLLKLQGAVDGLDRLMDSRTINFSAPTVEGDTVTVNWTALYTKADLPDLEIDGIEYARFEGDRIAHLRDELDPEAVKGLVAWLTDHGSALTR